MHAHHAHAQKNNTCHTPQAQSRSPLSAHAFNQKRHGSDVLSTLIVVMYVSEFYGRTSTARAGAVSVHLWASQNSLASVFFFTGKENMKGDIWFGVWWPERNYLSMSKTRYDGHFPTRRESCGSICTHKGKGDCSRGHAAVGAARRNKFNVLWR